MSVKIITDSASDISQKDAESLGITVMPLIFRFGEDEYYDGVTMTNMEFYQRMEKEDELPKTSQISPYRYTEVFDKAVKDGSEVIYLSISSGVSGSVHNAELVAQDYDGKVKVFDSKQFCISLRVLTEYAKRLADEGKTADEIVSLLEKASKKVRIIAVFDTLENLKKGGRISSTAAFFGEMLAIKPIITITDGVVEVLGKVRGMKKGFVWMREYIEKDGGIDLSMPFAAAYSGTTPDNILKFLEQNKDLYEEKEIPLSYVGATVGTYAGADAIAMAYFVK